MVYQESQGPWEAGADGADVEEEHKIHRPMGLGVEILKRRSNQRVGVSSSVQEGSSGDVSPQTRMRIDRHLRRRP